MKFEIKHRFSGGVLFALETESMRLCVEAAVKAGADLAGADLAGDYLARAYLAGANLAGADLAGAYLARADLAGADLAGAYLARAYLARAYLAGANGRRLTLIGNRPILHIGPLGSRSDTLQAAITDHGVYVRTGCFWDTLDVFRSRVTETHGEGVHAQEYAAAITLIETHARLWTPENPA